MGSRTILTNNNDHKYIEYDGSKFDIEYHRPTDTFIIRYNDGWTLGVIPSKEVGFIIQSYVKKPNYKEPQARFIMSRYNKDYKEWFLEVCHPNGEALAVETRKRIQYSGLDYIRIKGNTFEIYDDEKFKLYNVDTDMESESFKKIITTHEKTSYIGEDAIMVTQERGIEHPSTYVELFKDYIVYGIDPETFEATTPIWSQLQDKTIPICSKEEYKKNGIEKETRTQYTIRTKIDGYMQKMMDRIPKRNYDLIDRELAGIHLGFKPSKKKKNEEENK